MANPLVLFSGWFNGLDQGDQPAVAGAETTTLKNLPIEVRVQIWEYLSIQDHRAIRKLCKQFQWEINQIVGVHAILFGPKPWKPKNFAESMMYSMGKTNPETIRAKQNIEWISNSVIRSLKLTRFNGTTFDPRILISNEHILRRLVVQLEMDLTPKPKVMDILNRCKNMETIAISCHYELETQGLTIVDTDMTFIEVCEPYRKDALDFSKNILQSILTKPLLKNFCLCVYMRKLRAYRFGKHTFMGILNEEPDEPRILTKYPSKIQKLEIRLPILKNTEPERSELISWKSLFDQQTQLVDLTVNLGFVHWTFFSNVIRNNVKTLRKLTLHLVNWAVIRTEQNWTDDVPVTDQFDWTLLLPITLNLTFLRVEMSSKYMIVEDSIPQPTLNFRKMELQGLIELKLRSVALDPEDFVWILSKIPSLRKVYLSHWSAANVPDLQLIEIALTTFRTIFHTLMRSIHLEQISLWDVCLQECPKYLQGLMDALPNYKTDWPKIKLLKLTLLNNVAKFEIHHDRLLIRRKPEAELIPVNCSIYPEN